ncbi:MAG TPA: MFS transporter [Solirubrobacteraceae bacterium]|nr:MFS transporter [Solirubrobacteraceae bacterium]
MHSLRLPAFRRLAATYTLNELADWFATIALSVLVYDATRDPFATTALFVCAKFAPGLLVPPLAAWLDGRPVARVLAYVYVLETIALVVLAVTASAFLLPLVLALALFDGTLAAVARATTRSATVAVLEPEGRLREGNAALNIGFSVMNGGAPILGGLLVALLSPGAVLAIAAGVFAGMALLIGTARGLPAGDPEPSVWRARLREGLAYVRADPTLRTLLFGQAFVLVLLTMATPIEVVYAKESLDAGDVGFGALVASWGVGMVIGSALFARERSRSTPLLVASSTVLCGLGYVGMATAPELVTACAAAALGGIGNGVQWVSVVTALQEATEERFQARVAGLLEAVMAAGPGVGFLLGGTITALLSPRAAFAVAGGGVIAVVLVAGLVLARRRAFPRTPPVAAADGARP